MTKLVVNEISHSKNYKVSIYFDPAERKDEIIKWINNERFDYFPQYGTSLGERISNAFNHAFFNGYKKVIAIGTDCPKITQELVNKAFDHLTNPNIDIVIGPADDGGYYLVGLSTYIPEIFDGIEWSTGKVLKQTLDTIKRAGFKCTLLRNLKDIDTISDINDKEISVLLNISNISINDILTNTRSIN